MPIDPNDPKIAEQIPINQAIGVALVQSMPEGWSAVELQIDWPTGPEGKPGQMEHRVVNADSGDSVTPAADVTAAALQLDAHRLKHDMPWQSACYRIARNEAGQWQANARFALIPGGIADSHG
jgi:hypothetical protein